MVHFLVETLKIAVFVSGRGSNLRALVSSEFHGRDYEVVLVVSDKKECPAFEFAQKHKIPVHHFSHSKEVYAQAVPTLVNLLESCGVELIVLAGYLKLIPVEIITRFRKKIINIHPALLPDYGGKGMYGMNVHQAVFEAKEKFSGPTVHYVDEEYDRGEIIEQVSIDVTEAKSSEEIARIVLEQEHKILPRVVSSIAREKK